MKVFFSWSGKRSFAVAQAFSAWISQVIQAVDPWISSEIAKGTLWQTEVADKLDEAKVGVVCLTSGNLNAPWILFEAGALSKRAKESYVCTFLLDVTPTDVEPPLGNFQHTLFTKEDVKRLLETINNALNASGERPLPQDRLHALFEKFWPELEAALTAVISQAEEKPARRRDRDLLEEILEHLRSQEQRRLAGIRTQELWRKLKKAQSAKMIGATLIAPATGQPSAEMLTLVGRALQQLANPKPPSQSKETNEDTNPA